MADHYPLLLEAGGAETFVITDVSGPSDRSAAVRGIYDRRFLEGEIQGADYAVPDFRIGVATVKLPAWVARGCVVDVRGETLEITRLEPDGQGLTYLVLRPRPPS